MTIPPFSDPLYPCDAMRRRLDNYVPGNGCDHIPCYDDPVGAGYHHASDLRVVKGEWRCKECASLTDWEWEDSPTLASVL